MIALALDTHALIWLLHGDERLSETALRVIETTREQGNQLAMSSISLVEVAYLEEKGRIPHGTLAGTLAILDAPFPALVEIPVTRHIVTVLLSISRADIPDTPDRVIAATAASLGVPLVSRDRKIQTSQVHTIW
jgi:PIN domain nuclease of toxin-antitoxin system